MAPAKKAPAKKAPAKKAPTKKAPAKKAPAKKAPAPKASSKTTSKAATKAVSKAKSPPTPTDEPIGVVLMVFTKCKDGYRMIIGKEPGSGNWNLPNGYKPRDQPETLDKTAERVFKAVTGHALPKAVKQTETRRGRIVIRMIAADSCVDEKLGKDLRKEYHMDELKHIALSDLYGLVQQPSPSHPLRPVFISMLVEMKKDIEAFCKSL